MDVGGGSDHGPTASDATRSPRWFVIVVNNPLTSYDQRAARDRRRRVAGPGRHRRFFGEGFDYARLATLFLALPISWRGTLAQYAGRLHRPHATKREVHVYDYVDVNEPMLAKMAAKRETGYRSLGYRKADEAELALGPPDAACSSSFADCHDPRLQTSRCANPTSTRLIRCAETMSIIQSSSLVPVFLGECQFNNEFKRLRGRCTKIPRVRILFAPPPRKPLI